MVWYSIGGRQIYLISRMVDLTSCDIWLIYDSAGVGG